MDNMKTDEDCIGRKQLLENFCRVKGAVGKISIIVYADTGAKCELVSKALYIPDARVHLLSVCIYLHPASRA